MRLDLKKIEVPAVVASVSLTSTLQLQNPVLLHKSHIEIISSNVAGLSSMSKISRTAAQQTLSKHYRKASVTMIDCLDDLDALIASRPDLVFLGMDFLPVHAELGMHDPDKIWVADYLRMHGIAHTGSGGSAHRLENNKAFAKQCIEGAGLNTAKYFVASKDDVLTENEVNLSYPLFVKPTDRGGGTGIDSESLVYNFQELKSKVDKLASVFNSDSLVEEYLSGREFSVAILKQENGDDYEVMPIELLPPLDKSGVRILSKSVKSADLEVASIVTHPILLKKVTELAMDVFLALGVKDYGRIDIRLDENKIPYFLEANLIPSLIEDYGSFPKACALNLGMTYEDMLLRIANLGIKGNITLDSHHQSLVLSSKLSLHLAI